jgi:hypothetical protein
MGRSSLIVIPHPTTEITGEISSGALDLLYTHSLPHPYSGQFWELALSRAEIEPSALVRLDETAVASVLLLQQNALVNCGEGGNDGALTERDQTYRPQTVS